jgi:hypothetical protein
MLVDNDLGGDHHREQVTCARRASLAALVCLPPIIMAASAEARDLEAARAAYVHPHWRNVACFPARAAFCVPRKHVGVSRPVSVDTALRKIQQQHFLHISQHH